MVARFSMTSFIGMVRTEVAVGIDSDASMLRAVRIGAPLNTVRRGSALESCGRSNGFGTSGPKPPDVPGWCGVSVLSSRRSTVATGALVAGTAAGRAARDGAGSAAATSATGVAAAASAVVGAGLGAGVTSAGVCSKAGPMPAVAAEEAAACFRKKSTQA